MPDLRRVLVCGTVLLACRGPGVSASVDATAIPLQRPGTVVFESTIVHELAVVDSAVVLVGQRRSEAGGSEAWVVRVSLDGELRWQATRGEGFAWAEAVRIDTSGGVHVFGRDDQRQAWLWSLDGEGHEVAFVHVPTGERFGFGLTATQVQLFVSRDAFDEDPTFGETPVSWIRRALHDGTDQLRDIELSGVQRWYGIEDEIEPLSETIFTSDHEMWRLDGRDASTQLVEIYDDDEADAILNALPEPPPIPESLALTLGQPLDVELGSSSLVLVQLPPQAGADARLLFERVPTVAVAASRARFEAAATMPTELADPLASAHAQAWTWPLVSAEALTPKQQHNVARWLLDGAPDCEAREVSSSCGDETLEHRRPSYLDPTDPCWQLLELERLLPDMADEVFTAELPRWVALLESNDTSSRLHASSELRWDLGDAILDAAVERGQIEALFGQVDEQLDDSSAVPLEIIARFDQLPSEQAVALAHTLIADLRADQARCEEVQALTAVLAAHEQAPPRWQADLHDACDMLYVSCTGLEPGLEDKFVGAKGFTVTDVCDDGRPTDEQLAEALGISACEPGSSRETEFVDVPKTAAVIAAECGSDEILTHFHYTCGVRIELEVHRYEWSVDADGRVWFEGLDIVHTTGE
jgi:hypothetical protein